MLFISHTSSDKPVVRRLSKDLETAGFPVWLDEWQIRAGECIATAVEAALASCRFVIVALSPKAVASGWVDREWKAKYWTEIEEGTVRVIPVLIEKCSVPLLLRTKRYADLNADYGAGLAELVASLKAYIAEDSAKDFYAYAPIVSKQLISDPRTSVRNVHWDRFSDYVSGLQGKHRLEVQEINTLSYLRKWGLTVLQLRRELAALGFPTAENPEFSSDLAEALERLQSIHCMRHIDGVFGQLTYREMYKLHSDAKG